MRDQAGKLVSSWSDAHASGQSINWYKGLDNLAVPKLVIGRSSLASLMIVGILEPLCITAGKSFKSIGIILVDVASLVGFHESVAGAEGNL